MAYTPCIIGGGGSQYTETSLWTNASPSSNFSTQTITLSDSISKYKYIKFTYKVGVSVNTSSSFVIDVTELKKSLSESYAPLLSYTCNYNSVARSRGIVYVSDTQLTIRASYNVNNTGGSDATCIPLEILGLNELDTGTKTWDSGTIPYNSSSTTKITLGYKPKILILRYYKSTSAIIDNIYTDSISTSAYQRWVYSGSASMVTRTLPRGTSESRCITSIDNDGFTVGPNDDNTYTCYYWATGES